MQQDRPALSIAQPFEHIDQQPDVVTVNRAGVAETHLLEQGAITPRAARPRPDKGAASWASTSALARKDRPAVRREK